MCGLALAQDKATPDSASFPITDGLAATVVGTPPDLRADLSDVKPDFSVRTIDPLVERDTPDKLRYARPLQYLLVRQDHPAPLAFVIAGTGASALSNNCVLLSRALYAEGYHVACLPSPTSVTFMLGAAEHPVPGYMPADVRDLYRLMKAVRADIRQDSDIDGYVLTGWSLGATEAAFVARYDERMADFGFSNVLLINPAVSVWDSVKRIDGLLADNLEGGIEGIPNFVARALGGIRELYAGPEPLRFDEDFLYDAYSAGTANEGDLATLIGLVFRLSLANMAFASDLLERSDVIVPRDVRLGPYDDIDVYIRRAFEMTFSEYINRMLLPYWNSDGRHVSRAELIASADLHSIGDYLADRPRIGVFSNADDPILGDGDVDFLRATFGDRARIRAHGGHLGNLDYGPTIHALQRYFQP